MKTSEALAMCNQLPALEALTAFVFQRPGFEPGNYQGCPAAYRQDAARAATGKGEYLRHLRHLRSCFVRDLTNADIVEASKGSRCRVYEVGASDTYAVDYTTGQYFPTEYRAAAARVLDLATSRVYERQRIAATRNH